MESENLKFLYGLSREGIKLDLAVTREFAGRLGNPQDEFRSFHVAGTNGMGSTSAFIYNILMRKYHTGLYTSPHLRAFNERIIFDRQMVPDSYIEEFVDSNHGAIVQLGQDRRNPTFFEITTLLAFKYFTDMKAQYASVEVGLGGRLDSTNILKPAVSVITHIGYEHADKLGCSLTSIAGEKGGIIKPGIPVILNDQKPEVVQTIRKLCEVKNSRLIPAWEAADVRDLQMNEDGTRFTLETQKAEYKISSTMLGRFQVDNIVSSILAVEQISDLKITRPQIEKGISTTRWPARMDVIRSSPKVMVDCAHNPAAANALARSFSEMGLREPLMVIGMLSDKDSYSYLRAIGRISKRVIFTSPNEPLRALPPGKLAEMGKGIFASIKVEPEPIRAYEIAKEDSDFVLVTGSMYLVGTIMDYEKVPVMPFHKD